MRFHRASWLVCSAALGALFAAGCGGHGSQLFQTGALRRRQQLEHHQQHELVEQQ